MVRTPVATLLLAGLALADPFPGYEELRAKAGKLWKEAPEPGAYVGSCRAPCSGTPPTSATARTAGATVEVEME
jgi:hypothetical protein